MSLEKRRVALVTGSTSGIGLGIAHRLAENGCDVIITGIAEKSVIDGILEEFKKLYKGNCSYVGGDFTKEDEIAKLCKEITTLYPEGIDILINNAGFLHACTIDEFPIDMWHKMVAVHLTASFLFIRYFLPYMKKKGWGRIVHTSSIIGIVSAPAMVPYSAVKAALIGLAKGTAVEVAEFGITCNAVCPGSVDTELLRKHFDDMALETKGSKTSEDLKDEFLANSYPTKRLITVQEVAGLVCYLCSDDAASITGSAICIDGGYTSK